MSAIHVKMPYLYSKNLYIIYNRVKNGLNVFKVFIYYSKIMIEYNRQRRQRKSLNKPILGPADIIMHVIVTLEYHETVN